MKDCSCGRAISKRSWGNLPFIGTMDNGRNAGEVFELRNCSCGSTLASPIGEHAPPTDRAASVRMTSPAPRMTSPAPRMTSQAPRMTSQAPRRATSPAPRLPLHSFSRGPAILSFTLRSMGSLPSIPPVRRA